MGNDEPHKPLSTAEREQISSSILLLNNAIEQLAQEQLIQKEQALKRLDDAIEQLSREQLTQREQALKRLDDAIKKLSQKQLSEKEKILKRLNDAIKKLSSTDDSRPRDSIFTRAYNYFFRRPRRQSEEPHTPAIPYFFDDFSMQDDLSSNHNIPKQQPFPGITIEIDLEDIEKDALYGIPLRFDTLDTDEETDTSTTSTDTDTSQPISPPPAILHTTPSISSTPSHPPVPNHNTRLQDRDSSTTQRDTVPPPIINTVLPTTLVPPPPRVDNSTSTDTNSRATTTHDTTPPIINTVVFPPTPIPPPIPHIPKVDHTPTTTTQDIASYSAASNFLPPYLQRQMQQEKLGNKTININLVEYLHHKERKKSTKFNNILNNNQQLHKDKYFTGEKSQVSKFNENAANIYKNVQVSSIASQQFFEVSNNIDSKVKVSLVEKTNSSKLMIQSQSDNSTDLMLSITMETKKQLGPKANMKIYIAENTNEKYIKELIELFAKSISLGLTIQLLPPKNHPHPEQYSSTIASVINSARATAPNIDPRLLPNPPSNRR